MKVAVASKDGMSINLHFGHAKSFIIYEITDGQLQQIDNREVDHYCHGQHGDQSALQKSYTPLTIAKPYLLPK